METSEFVIKTYNSIFYNSIFYILMVFSNAWSFHFHEKALARLHFINHSNLSLRCYGDDIISQTKWKILHSPTSYVAERGIVG